jgi:3-hydroxyisobutyrate dehydrogenase-like beta-hydroxyacid dehydrogenase
VPSAAILYPGEMGCAVGKVLVADGWSVCTHLNGPSLVCHGDAEAAAIEDRASLEEAFAASDLIVSLVPPAAAVEVAEAAAKAARGSGWRPLYLDANSVSPETVTAVAAAVAAADLDCVDGAFVGSAAELGGRTRLYVSGPRSAELAAIMPRALHAESLGLGVGAASGLKLAFAGFNKGLVALFLEVMAAGEAAGDPEVLLACLRDFYPGTVESLERLVPSYPRHAARRVDELGELARWLAAQGLDAAWAAAARDVVRRLAALDLDASREWTLADVVAARVAASPPRPGHPEDDDADTKP